MSKQKQEYTSILSEHELQKYEAEYYKMELEKCMCELQELKKTMRNLDQDELTKRKMSQDILESKLFYYNALLKFSAEGTKKKKKQFVQNDENVQKNKVDISVIEKKDRMSLLIERYYDRMLKKMSAHIL